MGDPVIVMTGNRGAVIGLLCPPAAESEEFAADPRGRAVRIRVNGDLACLAALVACADLQVSSRDHECGGGEQRPWRRSSGEGLISGHIDGDGAH